MTAGHLGAGPPLFGAEHRSAAQAPLAAAAGGLDPRHADAVSDPTRADTRPDTDDLAHRLMTKRARKRTGQLASRLMDVGVADATCVNLDQHLSWPRLGGRHFLNFPPRIDRRNDCGSHWSISLSSSNGRPSSFSGFSWQDDTAWAALFTPFAQCFGERAAAPSAVESSLQRRPDLPVDHQIGEMVEVGLLAIDDDQAGAGLLRQGWKPRRRIDRE